MHHAKILGVEPVIQQFLVLVIVFYYPGTCSCLSVVGVCFTVT